MKLFLRNYLLLALITLLTLFSCVEESTTDSNHPSTPPLAIDYGISENFYIALTNTALELTQKGNFGNQSNFSISPPLPNGLSIGIISGSISGTPTKVSLPTPYTVTASKSGKTYTNIISLGIAPSVVWVTNVNPFNSYQLTAFVVGDGSKQIDDWTWDSSDSNSATVSNGLVRLLSTASAGATIISASKDSYSNGMAFTISEVTNVNGGKIIKENGRTHLIITNGKKIVVGYQFQGSGLTSVVIPNSLTSIDRYAFENNKLANLVIPSSVINIGYSAFRNNKLKNLTIGNGVIAISIAAFEGNQLTNVTIGNSVETIGGSAFVGNQLTSVVIPNSVTNIGRTAFAGNQLTNIMIGNSVTSIGYNAFLNNQLKSVIIPNSVTSIGSYSFQNNLLTRVIIGTNVTYIDEQAFYNNKITNVVIPNSVKTIANLAFFVNKLTSLRIGNSVISVGQEAFSENLLTRVIIPDSVKTIGKWAFYNNQLTSVVIGNSVTTIGEGAFTENSNLVEVSLKQSLYNNIVTTSSTNTVFGTQVTNYIKRP